MSAPKLKKPKLATNLYVWSSPPDASGDEALHFVSQQRRVKLKGHSFREFLKSVIPLLDGRHTVEEIGRKVAHVFELEDVEAGLRLMAEQNLLEEAEGETLPPDLALRIRPQLNFFREVEADAEQTQRRLSESTVTVLGMGGAGASASLSLAAAGVGNILCADAARISPADGYFTPVFGAEVVGEYRAEVVRRRVEATAPQVNVSARVRDFDSEDELAELVGSSDFVVCALDAGLSSLIYKLNRVCLRERVRWTSCALSGAEVILGPTVHPFETACYLCYRMRAVACSNNPEDAFAFESFLDRRKSDDVGVRENLVFGAGIASGLIGLEALKELSGVLRPAAAGKIFVFNLMDFEWTRHVVLREPACPACSGTLT